MTSPSVSRLPIPSSKSTLSAPSYSQVAKVPPTSAAAADIVVAHTSIASPAAAPGRSQTIRSPYSRPESNAKSSKSKGRNGSASAGSSSSSTSTTSNGGNGGRKASRAKGSASKSRSPAALGAGGIDLVSDAMQADEDIEGAATALRRLSGTVENGNGSQKRPSLSALAPSFSFNPSSSTSSLPLPSSPATMEVSPVEHLSPLAPLFEPSPNVLAAVEPNIVERDKVERGLGLSSESEFPPLPVLEHAAAIEAPNDVPVVATEDVVLEIVEAAASIEEETTVAVIEETEVIVEPSPVASAPLQDVDPVAESAFHEPFEVETGVDAKVAVIEEEMPITLEEVVALPALADLLDVNLAAPIVHVASAEIEIEVEVEVEVETIEESADLDGSPSVLAADVAAVEAEIVVRDAEIVVLPELIVGLALAAESQDQRESIEPMSEPVSLEQVEGAIAIEVMVKAAALSGDEDLVIIDPPTLETTIEARSTSSPPASDPTPLIPPPQIASSRRRRSSSSSSSSSRSSSTTGIPLAVVAPASTSLTLAILSAWNGTSWARKVPAVLASVFINFGLPFINGVMLGFGELFAREVIGLRLGWGSPFSSSSSSTPAPTLRANTGGVGLRSAGLTKKVNEDR